MEDEGFSTAVAISIVIGIIIFILAVVLLVLFFCKERGKKFSFFQLSRSFIFFIWFFFNLNNPFIIPCWKILIKKVDIPRSGQTSLLWQYYCITLSHWNHHLYPCCCFTCSFILERKRYHIWKLFRK